MRAIIAPVIFLLSFSRCFPPKTRSDSICFTWIDEIDKEIDRQIACHLKIDHCEWWRTRARVCIFTTHQRGKQNCVALNRLATHLLCSTDPLQMIGSRVVVIINFALFWASSSPPGFLSICLKSNNTSRWTGVDTYIAANLLLLF